MALNINTAVIIVTCDEFGERYNLTSIGVGKIGEIASGIVDMVKARCPSSSSWEQRLIIEKKELDVKFHELLEFVGADVKTAEFKRLPSRQKELLLEQLDLMGKYSAILQRRIIESELVF